MKRRRAVVVDPTAIAESRHIALGLLDAGHPVTFHTSFELRPDSRLGRLPATREYTRRRRRPDFDRIPVRNWYFPDLVAVAARRIGPQATTRGYLLSNVALDVIGARALRRDDALAVVRQGAGLRTLTRARSLGVPTLLLTGTPDPAEEWAAVLAEIRALGMSEPVPDRAAARLHARIRREYRLADMVLAASEYAASSIRRASGRESTAIAVLPRTHEHPVGQLRRRPANGTVRVLFVGSIDPRKGVHHLARAVHELRAAGSDVELDLVGPSRSPEFEAVLRPFLSERVRLRGAVPREQLADVYGAADVFVLPSISDGFGMVVPEAQASGLPVIVTDRCGAQVRHGDQGLVVPAGDMSALRDAIGALVDDPGLRAQMGAASRRHVDSWNWAAYRRRALELIEERLLVPNEG